MKLNGTNQPLVYIDNVEILGGSVHVIKKNTETLVLASKENELEVNADETKYMVISRDQNAGLSHSMKTDTNSFESVEKFKYFGTILTHQISIQENKKLRAD